jgi:hypothetical protein
MARHVVFKGRVFGIDTENPNRVRFGWPFRTADKHDWLEPDAGAVTDLRVVDEGETLVIECGLTSFTLRGSSPATWVLRGAASGAGRRGV